MENKDFRVSVTVMFDLDIGAANRDEAEIAARKITRGVFKESFGRAECVSIPMCSVLPIKTE